jgi:hypothetical protein
MACRIRLASRLRAERGEVIADIFGTLVEQLPEGIVLPADALQSLRRSLSALAVEQRVLA